MIGLQNCISVSTELMLNTLVLENYLDIFQFKLVILCKDTDVKPYLSRDIQQLCQH